MKDGLLVIPVQTRAGCGCVREKRLVKNRKYTQVSGAFPAIPVIDVLTPLYLCIIVLIHMVKYRKNMSSGSFFGSRTFSLCAIIFFMTLYVAMIALGWKKGGGILILAIAFAGALFRLAERPMLKYMKSDIDPATLDQMRWPSLPLPIKALRGLRISLTLAGAIGVMLFFAFQ
jgi:uncharacterized membrane protein